MLTFLAVSFAVRLRSPCEMRSAVSSLLRWFARLPAVCSNMLSSLYSILPPLSLSSEAKHSSDSACVTSNPRARRARKNSFLSILPLPSSSHCLKRSITRSDERDRAMRNSWFINSLMSTKPSPEVSSASNRVRSASSVCSLCCSRARMKVLNSPKSISPSWSPSTSLKLTGAGTGAGGFPDDVGETLPRGLACGGSAAASTPSVGATSAAAAPAADCLRAFEVCFTSCFGLGGLACGRSESVTESVTEFAPLPTVEATSAEAAPGCWRVDLCFSSCLVLVAFFAPRSERARLNSSNSMKPSPFSFMLSKSSSTSFLGTSYPSAAMPWRSSFLLSAPLASSSHSLNRETSLIECCLRISTICSCMLLSGWSSSFTVGGSTDTRALR